MKLKRVVFTGFLPRPDGDQKDPVGALQSYDAGRGDYVAMLRLDGAAVWASETSAYPLHMVAWYELEAQPPARQAQPPALQALPSAGGKRRRKRR